MSALEDLVWEWQQRFKALDAHLDTQPDSSADEDLERWNARHDELFGALETAEKALVAYPLARIPPAPKDWDQRWQRAGVQGALPNGEDD